MLEVTQACTHLCRVDLTQCLAGAMLAGSAFLSSTFLCTVQDRIKQNTLASVAGLPSSNHWARMHKLSNRFSLEAKWLRRGQHYITQKGKDYTIPIKYTTNDCLVLKLGTNKPTALSLEPLRFYCLPCSPPPPLSVKRGIWESLNSSQSLFNKHLTEHLRSYSMSRNSKEVELYSILWREVLKTIRGT